MAGTLSVSSRSIDLGRTASRGTFAVTNTGDLSVVYTVSSRTRWLQVSPIGGQLAGGGTRRVTIGADRQGLPEGRSTGNVVVSWDGGSVTVRVSLVEERGPVVGAPSVPPNSSCDVTVTVRASDESGVGSVRLAWSGPAGSGATRMSRAGTVWSATVHITLGGSYTFRATATDSRGNTTTGPSTTASLNPCPQ